MADKNELGGGGIIFYGLALLLLKGCEDYRCKPVTAERLKNPKGIEYIIVETRKGEKFHLQETNKGYYLNNDTLDWEFRE